MAKGIERKIAIIKVKRDNCKCCPRAVNQSQNVLEMLKSIRHEGYLQTSLPQSLSQALKLFQVLLPDEFLHPAKLQFDPLILRPHPYHVFTKMVVMPNSLCKAFGQILATACERWHPRLKKVRPSIESLVPQ